MVDNLIVLFEHDETSFNNNGLGNLHDASKCEVIEELNGAFELEIEYPITGIHYDDIQLRRIIFVKPNNRDPEHAFRIYSISKPINGVVTINAEHISYDLTNYIVPAFKATTSDAAIGYMNATPKLPHGASIPSFSISSNIHQTKDMESKVPTSKRALIANGSGSFIDTYGGEVSYASPGFDVTIKDRRGSDHGVSIEYGKNLTDIRQEENCSNMYTHILPYFYYYNETTETDDDDNEITTVEERTVTVDGDLIPVNNYIDQVSVAIGDDEYLYGIEAYFQTVKNQYPDFNWSYNANGYYVISNINRMQEFGMWEFSEEDVSVDLSYSVIGNGTGIRFCLYDKNNNFVGITESATSDEWAEIHETGVFSKIQMMCTSSVNEVMIKWFFVGTNGPFIKVLPVDVSSNWNNTHAWTKQFPSKDQVNEIGMQYLKDNDLKSPKIDITVSFEMLSQTRDYQDYSRYESVELGDDVQVIFPKMGIKAKSRCVKTTYNVLTRKYTSIELGEGKSDFAYKMVESQKKAEQELIENSDSLTDRLNYATKLISGNIGGYVVMHDSNGDGNPDEILIMDTPDINTAVNVWRWNQSGLAHSAHGYAPDVEEHPDWGYDTAITQAGEILGQFIQSRSMSANAIHGGTLVLGGDDNVSGTLSVLNELGVEIVRITKDSIEFKDTNGVWRGVTINSKGIVADSVNAEDINAGTITGSNIHVGKTNDNGGQIIVYDGNNSAIIVIDHLGIRFKDSDGAWHLTEITADGIKAGSVDAEDINAGVMSGMIVNGGQINGAEITSEDGSGGETTYIVGGQVQTNALYVTRPARLDNGVNMYNNDYADITRYNNGGTAWTVGEILRFGSGAIFAQAAFQATSMQVVQPGTSTAASNCRLTTLDAQGGGTAGLIWYAAGSSIRYKHDFKMKFDDDLDPHNLYDIVVYQYKYQTNYIENEKDIRYDKNVVGFIAEQLEKHYPIAVDWYYDKEKDHKVATDWSEKYIIPPMLKLIQEQHDEIEDLKKRLSLLESKFNDIFGAELG